MNQATFTVPQRKALIELLDKDNYRHGLWIVAKNKYDEARSSKKQAFIRASVNKEIQNLIDDITSCRDELHQMEADLSNMTEELTKRGFSLEDDGEISVESRSPISKAIEKRLDDELGSFEEVLTKPFETARVKLWSVETAEEAEKLMGPFLNFEVKVQ